MCNIVRPGDNGAQISLPNGLLPARHGVVTFEGARLRARGLARRDARRFDHVTLMRGAAFLLCLLVCALVLEHYCERSRGRAAELKALALLKQWLSPAQLAQYNIHGHFEVTGRHSGKR